jgi:RecA-family ATPase
MYDNNTGLDEDEIRERMRAASDPIIPGRLASEVNPRSIRWLWPGYLPRGKLAEIIGDPDQGKSLIVASLAASITAGAGFPDGFASPLVGNVIIISTEDDDEDTLRPRLEAAGADLTKVRIITVRDRLPILPGDVKELKRWILADKALALFLDPLDFLSR